MHLLVWCPIGQNAIANNHALPADAVSAPPVATISSATSPGVAAVEELIDYTPKHGASPYKQGAMALRAPFTMKAAQVVILKNNYRIGQA